MRKQKLRLRSALLLCLLVLQLSACGKSGEEAVENDSIRLSNLKSASSTLSGEEKTLLDAAEKIVENVQLQDKAPTYLSAVNTSGQELQEVEFQLTMYDKNDVIIGSGIINFDEWHPNEEINTTVGYYNYVGSYDHTDLTLEFAWGDCFYITEPIRPNGNSSSGSREVTLELLKPLPVTLRIDGSEGCSYTITDYSFKQNGGGTYALEAIATKDSGNWNSFDEIGFRILDENGVVVATGYDYVSYLDVGDRVRLSDTYLEIPEPGAYYLEFIA